MNPLILFGVAIVLTLIGALAFELSRKSRDLADAYQLVSDVLTHGDRAMRALRLGRRVDDAMGHLLDLDRAGVDYRERKIAEGRWRSS